nr:DExH-box ATP-dependent RNA helicase DExH3 [Ipomoea batatas]
MGLYRYASILCCFSLSSCQFWRTLLTSSPFPSEIYGKVVVISKVPLPNYRPDLDDKRPQREVVIPLSLQRRVEGLLQEHLDKIHLSSEKSDGMPSESLAADKVENVTMDENPDSFLDDSVMEKVLQRRSLRMRNLQRTWQV